jgi:spore coat protein CotH
MGNLRMRRFSLVTLLFLIVGFGLGAAPASSASLPYVEGRDAAAQLFDPTTVNRVDFIVPQTSIDIINYEFDTRSDPTNFSYVPAQIKITTASATYGPLDVGIHLKGGWGSLTPLSGKAGFKVKINMPGKKSQRILGLKKLTFNNAVQDGSYVHEATTYRLFRNVGVPAPRVGYVRVYMNCAQEMNPEPNSTCIDYGLHPHIETMDDVALTRWVNGTTHLFEGGTPYFPDMFDGATMQVDLGNEANTSDFNALARINRLDGAAWYKEMLKRTDLKEMTMEWATEMYVGHWDGYAANNNNFFLHSDATGKFRMFPWGTDQTWGGLQDLYVEDGWGPSMMVSKCVNYAPCRAMYTDSLVYIWSRAQAINLDQMPRDIYDGILASDMGPQTDPWRVCEEGCADGNVSQMIGFMSSRDAQVGSIARSLALTRPTLSTKLTSRTIALSWSATKVPGIAISSYQLQQSRNGVTWSDLTPDSATKIVIRNVTPEAISYYRVRVTTSSGTSPWSAVVRVRAS